MDQELLVNPQIEDGEKLLTQLVRSGFDVTVAFWVLTSEDSSWFVYIGSSAVVPGSFGDAYGMLYVSLTKIPGASVSLSEVKLVHPSEPIAGRRLPCAIAIRRGSRCAIAGNVWATCPSRKPTFTPRRAR